MLRGKAAGCKDTQVPAGCGALETDAASKEAFLSATKIKQKAVNSALRAEVQLYECEDARLQLEAGGTGKSQ